MGYVQTGKDEKKNVEIDDIWIMLQKLELKERLPLILTSSCQVRRGPKSLGSFKEDAAAAATRVMALETALGGFMELSKKQMKMMTTKIEASGEQMDALTSIVKASHESLKTPLTLTNKKRKVVVDDNDVNEISVVAPPLGITAPGKTHTTMADIIKNSTNNMIMRTLTTTNYREKGTSFMGTQKHLMVLNLYSSLLMLPLLPRVSPLMPVKTTSRNSLRAKIYK